MEKERERERALYSIGFYLKLRMNWASTTEWTVGTTVLRTSSKAATTLVAPPSPIACVEDNRNGQERDRERKI